MSLPDPADAKRALRALLRSGNHVRPDPGDTEAARLVDRLLALPLPAPLVIAGMSPLPTEPDLMPAWHALFRRGHAIVLPETTPRGERLRFRRWHPGCAMLPGRFSTTHPNGAEATPDLLFVPLLAWDRQLNRLGHGGGYYDRTLAALPMAAALGIGRASQEVATVPTGPYDVTLDGVLTGNGLLLGEGLTFADLVSGRHRRPQRP